jgi:hypothetical protein
MKITEFRKLIREEVRKVIKEAKVKAYALVIDEDGDFLMKDLAAYEEESYLNLESRRKISLNKLPKFPESEGAEPNKKWEQAVAKLGASYDYYDVNSDGGEQVIIAAVPVGTKPKNYIGNEEKKQVKFDYNATYKIDVEASRGEFDPSNIKKVSGQPLMVAKAVKKKAIADNDGDDEFVMACKLDDDTYYIMTGEESVTIVGKLKSAKYGAFWYYIGMNEEAAAEKKFDAMEKDAVKAKQI